MMKMTIDDDDYEGNVSHLEVEPCTHYVEPSTTMVAENEATIGDHAGHNFQYTCRI